MKIVEMRNKDNEKVLPDFIEQELSNSKFNVPSSYAVNKAITTEYIVATIESAQSASSNYKVNLNTNTKNGNFILENGVIKIGSGISLIEISGGIFIDNYTPGSYLWGIIKNNGVNVTGNIVSGSASYVSASLPTTILEVKEGDLISLIADSPTGGSVRKGKENTYICIKKLK